MVLTMTYEHPGPDFCGRRLRHFPVTRPHISVTPLHLITRL